MVDHVEIFADFSVPGGQPLFFNGWSLQVQRKNGSKCAGSRDHSNWDHPGARDIAVRCMRDDDVYISLTIRGEVLWTVNDVMVSW